ncbi:hypothetical protein ABRY94_12000 [Castellaniella ginsengisoli]|uniref:DUF551 domain-containing protein n=1 Tax=Castellaniella ginsengisoli TaxID=546114 RepID=A0AB39ER36_9BURK
MTDTYTPVLTDGRIQKIWVEHGLDDEAVEDFARAVERATIEACRRRFERATVPEKSQDWARLDGAVAWHLIERHADGWADVERMMGEFVAAKIGACQRQQWISVEDRLPPDDETWVYAMHIDGVPEIVCGCLIHETFPDRSYSHWMPLPPAPDLPTATVDNLVEKPMTDLRQQELARVEKTLSGE